MRGDRSGRYIVEKWVSWNRRGVGCASYNRRGGTYWYVDDVLYKSDGPVARIMKQPNGDAFLFASFRCSWNVLYDFNPDHRMFVENIGVFGRGGTRLPNWQFFDTLGKELVAASEHYIRMVERFSIPTCRFYAEHKGYSMWPASAIYELAKDWDRLRMAFGLNWPAYPFDRLKQRMDNLVAEKLARHEHPANQRRIERREARKQALIALGVDMETKS